MFLFHQFESMFMFLLFPFEVEKSPFFLCCFYFIYFFLLIFRNAAYLYMDFECVCFWLYTRISITCTHYTSQTWRKRFTCARFGFQVLYKCFAMNNLIGGTFFRADWFSLFNLDSFSLFFLCFVSNWIIQFFSFIALNKPNALKFEVKKN